jgi:hypothetical protein
MSKPRRFNSSDLKVLERLALFGGFLLTSLLSNCLREMRLRFQAQPCLENIFWECVKRAKTGVNK